MNDIKLIRGANKASDAIGQVLAHTKGLNENLQMQINASVKDPTSGVGLKQHDANSYASRLRDLGGELNRAAELLEKGA